MSNENSGNKQTSTPPMSRAQKIAWFMQGGHFGLGYQEVREAYEARKLKLADLNAFFVNFPNCDLDGKNITVVPYFDPDILPFIGAMLADWRKRSAQAAQSRAAQNASGKAASATPYDKPVDSMVATDEVSPALEETPADDDNTNVVPLHPSSDTTANAA